MKFRLRERYGQTAIREIGSHLRIHGSGHHWIEKFRGETSIYPGDEKDEGILRQDFNEVLDPVDDQQQ